MIKLNSNYDDIYKQMMKLKKNVNSSSDPNEIVSIMNAYYILKIFYCLQTGSVIDDITDRRLEIIRDEKLKQINEDYNRNFLNNKKYHSRMFLSCFKETSDIIEDFCDSKYYEKLTLKRKKKFNSYDNEDLDLLLAFFKEIDPAVKEIYSDMLKQGRIYKINSKCSGTGYTFFNSIDNIFNIFMRKKVPTVDYLASHVHETGHVIDNLDFLNRFSDSFYEKYICQSEYVEVLSTLFQQKFYEFLFENGVHKEDTMYEIINYFDGYLESIDELLMFSLIPDHYHENAVDQVYSRDELLSFIEQRGIVFDSPYISIPSFDDVVEYSYGILVANSVIHDSEKLNAFLNIRDGLFDAKRLESIGITAETAGKKLVKNLQDYISRV